MFQCIRLLLSGKPLAEEPRPAQQEEQATAARPPGKWDKTLTAVCCANAGGTFLGCVAAPCMAHRLRMAVLRGHTEHYLCCQGYHGGDDGHTGHDCLEDMGSPRCAMCLESCCCCCCAAASTRAFLGDALELRPDRCDNRIMRINNCFKFCLCCHFACMCCTCGKVCGSDERIEHLTKLLATNSRPLNCCGNLCYACMTPCMHAQVQHQLRHEEKEAAEKAKKKRERDLEDDLHVLAPLGHRRIHPSRSAIVVQSTVQADNVITQEPKADFLSREQVFATLGYREAAVASSRVQALQTHPLLDQWAAGSPLPPKQSPSKQTPHASHASPANRASPRHPAPAAAGQPAADPNDFEIMKVLADAQLRGEQLLTGQAAPKTESVARALHVSKDMGDTEDEDDEIVIHVPKKKQQQQQQQQQQQEQPRQHPELKDKAGSVAPKRILHHDDEPVAPMRPHHGDDEPLRPAQTRGADSPLSPLASMQYVPLARGVGSVTARAENETPQHAKARKTRAWSEFSDNTSAVH